MSDAPGRWEGSATEFARTSVAFLPAVLVLRLFESVTVSAAHGLPPGGAGLVLRGLLGDLAFFLCLSAAFAVLVVPLGRWRPGTARGLHRVLLAATAVTGAALAQYFAVTFVPLGADLFGYSAAEIRQTALISGGGGAGTAVVLVLVAVGSWLVTGLGRRLPAARRLTAAFGAAVAAALLLQGTLVPRPDAFASDAAYFVASSKAMHLARETVEYLPARWGPREPEVRLAGYPLLRPARYDDVLGPFLELGPEPPHIVLVVVEGLGRDFTGPGAHHGGFTPFLDSLAARSLFWDNFLATSGRTFGVLPALLGSLPPGEAGFMELGARMPVHHTLVSLLGAAGYSTSYFTGADGQYDRVDAFLERQRVDRFVDASRFGPGYARAPADAGGFSWGYADEEIFRRALAETARPEAKPRLDVYQTVSTHEPFVPPRGATFRAEFARRLAAMPLSPARRDEYGRYEDVFATLLYTDDALRRFFEAYRRRPDFARTLFVVTGDHRLIPVPPRTRLDRYRVPFLVYSPMLRAPRRFAAVSTHLDVAPTLLSLLHRNYGLRFPDRAHWLGTAIDTARDFRNLRSVPLMRAKNTLDEYLSGGHLLSQDQLFRVEPGLDVTRVSDAARRAELRAELRRFRQVNRYVTAGNRLLPPAAADVVADRERAREDSLFRALKLERLNSDQLFALAREKALEKEYEDARLIARRALRDRPNLHDVRTLLGRTYAWERRFDEARPVLEEVVRRAPEYPDAHVALADLELWDGRGAAALARAGAGLAASPRNPELLLRRARALELLGRRREALATLDTLRAVDPGNADAPALRARLRR